MYRGPGKIRELLVPVSDSTLGKTQDEAYLEPAIWGITLPPANIAPRAGALGKSVKVCQVPWGRVPVLGSGSGFFKMEG